MHVMTKCIEMLLKFTVSLLFSSIFSNYLLYYCHIPFYHFSLYASLMIGFDVPCLLLLL